MIILPVKGADQSVSRTPKPPNIIGWWSKWIEAWLEIKDDPNAMRAKDTVFYATYHFLDFPSR